MASLLGRHVPGQIRLWIWWRLASRFGTSGQISRQPSADIHAPNLNGLEQREQHGGQPTAPQSPRTIEVLAAQHRTPMTTFRIVVVHGHFGMVHEYCQPWPMILQAGEHLALR